MMNKTRIICLLFLICFYGCSPYSQHQQMSTIHTLYCQQIEYLITCLMGVSNISDYHKCLKTVHQMGVDANKEQKRTLTPSEYNEFQIAEKRYNFYFKELAEDLKSCRNVACVLDYSIQAREDMKCNNR